MQYRPLGRTGLDVSAVSFGAWAIGGFWGPVDDAESMRALHAAADAGINFFDTADVYGDGHSERLIARFRRERPGEHLIVATKAGRQLPVQTADGYTRGNLTGWVDDSLTRLEMDRLDLLQLHCPNPAVYDDLRSSACSTISSPRESSGTTASASRPSTRLGARCGTRAYRTVQIIFNMFRLKPADSWLTEAAAAGVGVIARVPLASGLLTGKIRPDTAFPEDDHRTFNRHGERFDVGETFSGVPLEAAMPAVEDLRRLVPADTTLAQFALRWILMWDAVACTIPGARTARQATENAAAANLPGLRPAAMAAVREVYDAHIRPHVHGRW